MILSSDGKTIQSEDGGIIESFRKRQSSIRRCIAKSVRSSSPMSTLMLIISQAVNIKKWKRYY